MKPVDAWKLYVPRSFQQRVIEARLAARHVVDPRRRLPDFLIIGAQRAGTSSLYKWVEAHPDVVASLRKETEYLAGRWCEGEDWYRGHFPSRYRRGIEHRLHRRTLATFEASPNYLFHPRAPERAAALLPGVKLVALLRNPVERAFSHHQHEVRAGRESLSFEEALDLEDERLAGEEDLMAGDPCYRSLAWERYSYVSRGRYAAQIERWIAAFGRERLLVVKSEDLYRDTLGCYSEIVEFLGLPAWAPAAFRNHSYVREADTGESPRMADETRARLAAELEPHNRQLYSLLDRDFGWET